VLAAAVQAKEIHPDFEIGINMLHTNPVAAAQAALAGKLNMVWADNMGVNSEGLSAVGEDMRQFAADHPEIALFASVAFKYQPVDLDPARAARNAQAAGFIATTSGEATGAPPDLFKIASMSVATGAELAVASGMSPENVGEFSPLLSHILVASGIAIDEYRLDPLKLTQLIMKANS
jgi:predicted TIM-barrel enzyme